jgi:hypothetical protein
LKLAITADLGGHVGLAYIKEISIHITGGYKRVEGELVRFPTPPLTATVFISKLHLAGRYAINVS